MNSTNLFQWSVTQRPSCLDLTATPLVTDPLTCVVALGLFQAYIRVDLTDRGTNVFINKHSGYHHITYPMKYEPKYIISKLNVKLEIKYIRDTDKKIVYYTYHQDKKNRRENQTAAWHRISCMFEINMRMICV